MTTLYFDTATTGLWNGRFAYDDPRQPHMTRLAYWLPPDPAESVIVRPQPGWTIDAGASAVSGVTLEIAHARGVDIREVLSEFLDVLGRAEFVACFNAEFHQRVVERAATAAGMHLEWPRRPICLMREATPIIAKPRHAPGGGYAFPKLAEAYRHLTGDEFRRDVFLDSPNVRGRYIVEALRDIHVKIIEAQTRAMT